MKPLIFVLSVLFAFTGLSAQTPAWQPSPGHSQVPIWPGAAPDSQPVAGLEDMATVNDRLVAGRPWVGYHPSGIGIITCRLVFQSLVELSALRSHMLTRQVRAPTRSQSKARVHEASPATEFCFPSVEP
jgi:hypothetical protein